MTPKLLEAGYVASYNIPLDKKVYDTLAYEKCIFIYILRSLYL